MSDTKKKQKRSKAGRVFDAVLFVAALWALADAMSHPPVPHVIIVHHYPKTDSEWVDGGLETTDE